MVRTIIISTCLSLAAAVVPALAYDTPEGDVEVFPGDPIVITAIGEPARESEVPFGIRSITSRELNLLDATNLAEGLVRSEGIYLREYGGAGSTKTVSTRGSYAKQTLFMVDGQPVNNHQGGDVDFNALSLEDVDRVEVMSGPSSALYGANATAGVVNIVTRGVPEKPGVSFRGSYGTNSDVNTEVAAGLPLGNFGLNVGGSYRTNDGFTDNDDYEGKGGHVKFSSKLGDDATLWLRGQYHTSEVGVPGSLSYPTPLARQEDDFMVGNVGIDASPSDAWSTTGRVYYKTQERHYTDPDPYFPSDDTHTNDALGARGAAFYQLLAWNRLGLGGEFESVKTESTSIGDQDGSTWAVFAQEDLRFGDLTTVVGARYDSSSIFGGTVSPRVGARYNFNEVVSARASAGRSFRAPSFDELYWPDTGFGGGNPDLTPEYCWTYEAGPTFRLNDRFKAEFIYFYSDYEDLISGWPPENVDRSVVQGVELGVDASPLASRPTFDVALSGTYLTTEDRDTGEELNYRPEYSGFLELRYRHDFGDGAFALTPSVSGSFVGRQQYDYTDPVTYLTSKRWLPAYTLLGARVAFKVYYPEIFVAVKNLADEEYQTIYDYPMPGRTVSAGVALDF